jgi:Lipoprotein LpqB beta-propeller domain/Sporulation and spore germination
MIRLAMGIAAVAVVATACSGVPDSSAPQVIGPGRGNATPGSQPSNTPEPNVEPRAIVQEFLRANVTEPIDPRGPHEFLTPDEQRRWSDSTVTVLAGSVEDAQVGVAVAGTSHAVAVTVKGTQIGSLDRDGTYAQTPPGGAGQEWDGQYSLDPVNGQFRISDAPPGLVVYADEFAQVYRPVRLYFLDLSEKRLVPDLRYTALTSAQATAAWELTQLVAGPRPDLDAAVRNEIQPSQPHASVSINGQQARVELPGSSRLDGDVKQKVAAQLIATIGNNQPQMSLTITDGGVPVDTPSLPQAFTRKDVAALPPSAAGGQAHYFDTITDPPVFYVDAQGRLVTGDGKPIDGPLGSGGRYDLTSVAVTAGREDPDYYVAATIGHGADQTLWLGRASEIHKTSVPAGSLTRPSWLAGQKEVWVADGAHIYRVDISGARQTVTMTLPTGARITALRLSPEGSRIAMILTVGNQSQLWVGSVVRTDTVPNNGTARIDSPEPIAPPNYRLTDVAWSDDSTLWAVGTAGIWSVNVDGAGLHRRPSAGLPQAADSITIATGVLPWVSSGGYVFRQSSDWEGPGHRTTRGTNPVYQESYLD